MLQGSHTPGPVFKFKIQDYFRTFSRLFFRKFKTHFFRIWRVANILNCVKKKKKWYKLTSYFWISTTHTSLTKMVIKYLILVLQTSGKHFWKPLSDIYIHKPIIPDFVAKFNIFWGRVPDPLLSKTFHDLPDPVGALCIVKVYTSFVSTFYLWQRKSQKHTSFSR